MMWASNAQSGFTTTPGESAPLFFQADSKTLSIPQLPEEEDKCEEFLRDLQETYPCVRTLNLPFAGTSLLPLARVPFYLPDIEVHIFLFKAFSAIICESRG